MADIPSIFSGPIATASKTTPKTSKDPNQEGASKHQKHVKKKQKSESTVVDIPPKNQPTGVATKPNNSRVFNSFGNIGDSLISEAEYKRWTAKSREEKQALAARASLELFMFNTEQSKESENNASLIKALEDEVAKLKLDMKNVNSKNSNLESTNTTLQSELARQTDLTREKDKLIAELEDKISGLQLTTEKLETAQTNLQSDADKIKKEAFKDGIRTYCKTFLTGEPDYDWSAKFGKNMASFMADLAFKRI